VAATSIKRTSIFSHEVKQRTEPLRGNIFCWIGEKHEVFTSPKFFFRMIPSIIACWNVTNCLVKCSPIGKTNEIQGRTISFVPSWSPLFLPFIPLVTLSLSLPFLWRYLIKLYHYPLDGTVSNIEVYVCKWINGTMAWDFIYCSLFNYAVSLSE
jgi:hypothetical protein